jgi:hypothetical protein
VFVDNYTSFIKPFLKINLIVTNKYRMQMKAIKKQMQMASKKFELTVLLFLVIAMLTKCHNINIDFIMIHIQASIGRPTYMELPSRVT